METFALYLFKTSGILLVFWAIYHLFLKRETIFNENRAFLLSGLFVALLLPFIKIRQTVLVELASKEAINLTSNPSTTINTLEGNLDGWTIAFYVYLIGCLFFAGRFLRQLYAIRKLTKTAQIWKEEDFTHIETQKNIAPFSFFKSLFYNRHQFEESQLQAILVHEKVHAKEWHSLDVVFSELVKIVLWFNPLIWAYQRMVKQNLEFLADARTVDHFNKISYQYLMVSQATRHPIAITNLFFNSSIHNTLLGKLKPNGFIKKRIVMLNKNQSKQMNALKSLLVLPLLAVFLFSFSTEKVYEYHHELGEYATTTQKKVELIINKNTSDEELMKMMANLEKDGIDFRYNVLRNGDKQIIDISLEVNGEGGNGSSFKNSYNTSDTTNGISPLVIYIDLENNLVSIGTKGAYSSYASRKSKSEEVIWISSDDDEHEEVIIKEEDGKNKIFIDGEEIEHENLKEHNVKVIVKEGDDDSEPNLSYFISTDDNHEVHEKHIKIKKRKSKKGKNVMVIKDSDDEADVEILNSDERFFFIETEGKTPLYIIDGKEASKEEAKKLSNKEILTVDVFKGEAAKKKYGKKAKNGVVNIKTKKKN